MLVKSFSVEVLTALYEAVLRVELIPSNLSVTPRDRKLKSLDQVGNVKN